MTPLRLTLSCAALTALLLPGCQTRQKMVPVSAPLSQTKRSADNRRLLFAQIVEDNEPGQFAESGIVEGKPYQYFLRQVAASNHDKLRKQTQAQITFDDLMSQPGLHRGQVITLQRGVVLELSRIKLKDDSGLPPDYSVLGAVFVDSAQDVYGLRIVCPPGSKLYDKLQSGIDADALPVIRVTGFFMKLYARKTAQENEPPWRRPLLICPEPEFSQAIEPRQVWENMAEAGVDKLLPSERIEAPGAEERLIIEVFAPLNGSSEPIFKINDRVLGKDLKTALASALADFKRRLPEGQRPDAAAVLLLGRKADNAGLEPMLAALKAAGVKRVAIKREE